MDKKEKKNILDLELYKNKKIIVKYQGGRKVIGVLQGFDPLFNLVLDQTMMYSEDELDSDMRSLGLVICRGPAIAAIYPADGTKEIDNPFK